MAMAVRCKYQICKTQNLAIHQILKSAATISYGMVVGKFQGVNIIMFLRKQACASINVHGL